MFDYMRQLGQETIIYGLAGIATRFVGFFLVPIYTRTFPPEDYGVIGIITTTVAVISVFVVLGLDAAAGRWYYDNDDIQDRKKTIASWTICQVLAASIFGLLIFQYADQVAGWLLDRQNAGLYFRVLALWLPLNSLNLVTLNWLRFQRRPWSTTIFALVSSLGNILFAILLVVVYDWGLRGVFLAQLIAASISAIGTVILLRDWINPRHFSFPRLKSMLRFSTPLIPGAVAAWTVTYSDRYFIQYYTNSQEVGLYQVGATIALVVALFTNAFQQAWGPFAISIHNHEEAKNVYAASLSAYLVIACMIVTGLTLLAPEIVSVVATEAYAGAGTIVGFLALSYVMIGLTYIAAIGPTIVKQAGSIGAGMFIAAALNILLNFILVPHLGRVGSALAALLSQTLVPIYIFYRAQHLYQIPYQFGRATGVIIVTICLILLGMSWRPENIWLGILWRLGVTLIYIPLLFFLRIITPEKIKTLKGYIRHS